MNKFEKTKGEGKSMQNKQNTKAKVIVIAIAILLCLALAVGITGAFYQAQRRATGTVKMDKGIVIDYTGFGKTPNEGTWLRETTISFKLFEDADVQPGEKISLNDAGIKANASSVDFYARVKLSYEFYNGETKLETLPASFKASDLITTSATFFGSDWVDSGAGDGYYYYAAGSTLNKFAKTATTFVDLFATDAKFIIEGAGFKGATSDGEGGGFKIDDTTSINKIVVYLTLETLQGDATAEQAKALGWKISSEVNFAKVDEGKIVKSNTTEVVTDEQLNVTINGNETKLEEVKFPYDEEVTLKFDTRNVDYITLKYSNGDEETFGEKAEDFANDYLSETALKVNAKSSKGTVKGYTVGLWDSEYTGFLYSTTVLDSELSTDENLVYKTITDGIAIVGVLYDLEKLPEIDYSPKEGVTISLPTTELEIKPSDRVRSRNFKLKFDSYTDKSQFEYTFSTKIYSIQYPCTIEGIDREFNSMIELMNYVFGELMPGLNDKEFVKKYPTFTINFEVLCSYSLGSKKDIKEIGPSAFYGDEYANMPAFSKITISGSIERIGINAFESYDHVGGHHAEIILQEGIKYIDAEAFYLCSNSIELPSTILSIGKTGLGMVETVSIKATTPPTVNGELFGNSGSALKNIYVPAESVETYKAADGWKDFADKIQAIA